MSLITEAQLKQVCTSSKLSNTQLSNMRSVIKALDLVGKSLGMGELYNLASFIGQIMVESGEFKYDREIWGPTAQQKKYEPTTSVSKMLGNKFKGDGSKFRGYGPIQLTGRDNVTRYYQWCLANCTRLGLPKPPNFVDDPSKIATDPWEGLSALWYWEEGNPDRQSLNRYAKDDNQLMVTKKVNGGTTHYDRRLEYQARAALVLLGYGTSKDEVKRFQADHQPTAGTIDGLVGNKTHMALHKAMSGKVPTVVEKVVIKEKVDVPTPVPVKVESLDKPWYKDVDGVTQAGGGVLVTSAVGFLTNADTVKIVVIAAIMAVGFGIWYAIRRSKAKAQNAEVERISQVSPASSILSKIVGA